MSSSESSKGRGFRFDFGEGSGFKLLAWDFPKSARSVLENGQEVDVPPELAAAVAGEDELESGRISTCWM